jgi:hypothetical protein
MAYQSFPGNEVSRSRFLECRKLISSEGAKASTDAVR